MGTNYYRIPSETGMKVKYAILKSRIEDLDISDPSKIERGFSDIQGGSQWDQISPWDEFTQDNSVHLGKRSGGWKFCWNFHKDKYYSTKQELINFIREGRVVDEYGKEWKSDEFLEMAFNWDPEGWDTETYYRDNPRDKSTWFDYTKHYDRYVDGLRVSSSTEFS